MKENRRTWTRQYVAGPLGLTRTEIAVLALAADGAGHAGIGASLGYAKGSIARTIGIIKRKLGARNETHAVAIGIRAGIIA